MFAPPLAGRAALSDARVLLDHGRVTIRSQSAPLSDVLSRFAQATGAQVVYEAARPRQLVSVVIEAASPAEAIAQLLEGQGLNYALRLDPTGRNVEMLVVTGSAGSAAASTSAPNRPPLASSAPFAEEPDDELAPNGEVEPPPDSVEAASPAAPAGEPADDAASPGLAVPFSGPAPAAPPGVEPSGQGTSASPAPQPAQPQPPAAASYPAHPAVPPQPVYPGPASYPPRGE